MGRRSDQLYPFLVLGVVLFVAIIGVWLLAPGLRLGDRTADASRVGAAFAYEDSGFAQPTDYFFPKKPFFSYVVERTATGAYLNITANTTGQYNFFIYKHAYYAPEGGAWKYFNLTPINRSQSGAWNVSWIRGAARGRTPHLNLTNYASGGYLIVYACQEHAKNAVLNSTVAKALPADARAQLAAAFGSRETRYFCGLRLIDEYGLDENYWMLRDFTIPACADECVAGTKECENATIRTCSNENMACAAWTEEECPQGQWCETGTHTCTNATCTGDTTKNCTLTNKKGVCAAGTNTRTCVGGQWSSWGICKQAVSSSAETCDGLDNDCDGLTDEITSCKKPDLTITNSTCTNATGANVSAPPVGSNCTIHLFVKNAGTANVTGNITILRNSTYVNGASSATSLESGMIVLAGPLVPGTTLDWSSGLMTFPLEGTYTLVSTLDPLQNITESNETNNKWTSTYAVGTCADAACIGQDLGEPFCLESNLSRTYLCVYQDGCRKVTSEACAGGSACVTNNLDIGICQACSASLPPASTIDCGENETIVCGEKSYTVNGTGCDDGETCTNGACECSGNGCGLPDLFIEGVTINETGTANVSVCNQGSDMTDAVLVAAFTLIEGETADADGWDMGATATISAEDLESGACAEALLSMTADSLAAQYAFAVDPEDDIAESDETNNVWPETEIT